MVPPAQSGSQSPPSKADNRVELLAGGNQIEFGLANNAGRRADGVMITPDPGAYLLTALDFELSTYAWVLERAGAGTAMEKLRTALAGGQCLVSFSELATTELSNPQDVSRFFSTALRTAMDCAAIALKEAYLGFILSAIVGPVIWVIDGVKLALNGFVAAAETAFDLTGYRITINRPTKATGKWTMSDAEIESAAFGDIYMALQPSLNWDDDISLPHQSNALDAVTAAAIASSWL